MVIKMSCISSSHGHNAVRYAMDKDKGRKVELLRSNGIPDDMYDLTFSDVWDAMKMKIDNSRHKIKDALFRIEICPDAEESEGWTREDWLQCLDDAIRHLNSTSISDKSGKLLAKPTELDRCKWVATMHKDTDHWHIHLVACRITDDDRVQDSYRCETRALMAADAMAIERRWTKAQDRDNKRKERIHADALDVLRHMKRFDIGDYMAGMRARGWLIQTQTDGRGTLRGYSIGEETRHNGQLTGTVMFKSSQLKHGRDLMVSQLEKTWNRLHVQDANKHDISRTSAAYTDNDRAVVHVFGNRPVRISESINAIMSDNVILPSAADYADDYTTPVMPAKADILATAAALFMELITPTAVSGGGGGSSSELPWGRRPDEDDRAWAARCARMASRLHTPHHSPRRGYHR